MERAPKQPRCTESTANWFIPIVPRYIRLVREGKTYRFTSNQYPDDKQGFELKCYEIKKARYMYGDESYYLIKLWVVKEPSPLRIGSIGTLEITPDEPKQEPESKK